jgi:NAD(P)-dependent dehydrogenase (short-subunit alcohol dehydrogenase family)
MGPKSSATPCLTSLSISGSKVIYCATSYTTNSVSPDADLIQAFLVNATSIYFVTAAFLPLLAKSVSSPTGKVGSVINTTSNSGQLRMWVFSPYVSLLAEFILIFSRSEGSQLAYNVSQ